MTVNSQTADLGGLGRTDLVPGARCFGGGDGGATPLPDHASGLRVVENTPLPGCRAGQPRFSIRGVVLGDIKG